MLYTITLFIPGKQMLCADCSSTVQAAVSNHIESKFQASNKRVVTASHQTGLVKIENLELSDNQPVKDVVESLKLAINEAGFVCDEEITISTPDKLVSIHDLEANNESTSPKNMNKANEKNEWIEALSLLATGSALMIAEHMNSLPKPNDRHTTNLAVNIIINIIATSATAYSGRYHFQNAWRRRGAMDTLIALGCLSAIIGSDLIIIWPRIFGNEQSGTFFSVPLMTLGFLKISHILRDLTQKKINAQINKIALTRDSFPKKAWVLGQNEEWIQNSVNVTQIDSYIKILPNEMVSIDGILVNDQAEINDTALTGTAGAQIKNKNDIIFAGCINLSTEPVLLKTICLSQNNLLNTAYSNIHQSISRGTEIEWLSRYFLVIVLCVATLSSMFWGIFGPTPKLHYAMQVFMGVLFSACPCGLGLLTLNASMIKGLAFEKGLLIKTERIWNINNITSFFLDKCGTITLGAYELEGLKTDNADIDNSSPYYFLILSYVAMLEHKVPDSTRTAIGHAILNATKKNKDNITIDAQTITIEENKKNLGRGGKITIGSQVIVFGNEELLKEKNVSIPEKWLECAKKSTTTIYLPLFVSINGKIDGLLIFKQITEEQQLLKPKTKETLQWLINHGKKICLLTGDSAERASAIYNLLDIEDPAGLLTISASQNPETKRQAIQAEQNAGHQVMMLGDADNDDPAIKQANIGVAINSLASISENADGVLNDDLSDLVRLMLLVRIYKQSYTMSLIICFGINLGSILLASGVLYPMTRTLLDPMITGMIMAGSSFALVTNIAFFQLLGRHKINNFSFEKNKEFSPGDCAAVFFKQCCIFPKNDASLTRPLLRYAGD